MSGRKNGFFLVFLKEGTIELFVPTWPRSSQSIWTATPVERMLLNGGYHTHTHTSRTAWSEVVMAQVWKAFFCARANQRSRKANKRVEKMRGLPHRNIQLPKIIPFSKHSLVHFSIWIIEDNHESVRGKLFILDGSGSERGRKNKDER